MLELPFTAAEFFDVFAYYNERVWPAQLALNAAALACMALLLRPSAGSGRIISLLLAGLWAWVGVAYHFVHFTDINPAAWLFGAIFLAGSFAFAWFGAVKSDLRFYPYGGLRGVIGWALLLYAVLLYPLLGYLLGHRYPAAPTFGLPCPTTLFTLALLLFAAAPVPRWTFVAPIAWALIGAMAAFRLGVVEDLGLLAATVAAVAAATFWQAPRIDCRPNSPMAAS
jgi:hypothetical protein